MADGSDIPDLGPQTVLTCDVKSLNVASPVNARLLRSELCGNEDARPASTKARK